MKNHLLLYVLLLVGCTNKTAEVFLLNNYCGDIIILISKSGCNDSDMKIEIDENGIGYSCIDELFYNDKFKQIKITQNGNDVSNECNNIIQGINHKDGIEYWFLYFKKPCNNLIMTSPNDVIFPDYIDSLDAKNLIQWEKLK